MERVVHQHTQQTLKRKQQRMYIVHTNRTGEENAGFFVHDYCVCNQRHCLPTEKF